MNSKIVSNAMKYVGLLVYGGCVCNFVTNNIVTVVKCQQKSMYPTINKTANDDYVIVEILSSKTGSFKKNDVIVLKHPHYPRQLICKRIALVAFDRLPHKYTYTQTNKSSVVRRGHIWVEGDNSNCSCDSRTFGPVPLGLVMGKVTFRIWPLSQIGWIN